MLVSEDSKFLAMLFTIGPLLVINKLELVGDEEADELPEDELFSVLFVLRLFDENEFSEDMKPLSVSLDGSVLRVRNELDRLTCFS